MSVGLKNEAQRNWRPSIEKVQSKLSSWNSKTLSFGGKSTLIKSVLDNIPLFYLSIFKARHPFLMLLRSFAEHFCGEVMMKKLKFVRGREIRLSLSKIQMVVGYFLLKVLIFLCFVNEFGD